MQGQRFADVSAAAGLDVLDDSRGLAVVDWDQDGDLDLWMSNRTGPRIRFLRNDFPALHSYLAIRLQGTASNRDGIGARVEAHFRDSSGARKSVRTLRAGEGYLSQSSKWLHFGLGDDADVDRVVVHWPNGELQTFHNIESNRRYELTQGDSTPKVAQSREAATPLVASHFETPSIAGPARVVPHRKLPLPNLQMIDYAGSKAPIEAGDRDFVLLSLWATSCAPCISELRELSDNEAELSDAGIRWLPINVDDLEEDADDRREHARTFLAAQKLPVVGGLGTTELADKLDVAQRALAARRTALALPSSFLIDDGGKLSVVYHGAASVRQILDDVRQLSRADDAAMSSSDPRNLAVPFSGRWFLNPLPPDLLAIPELLKTIGRPTAALEYLDVHLDADGLPVNVSRDQLAKVYIQLGQQVANQGDLQRAIDAYEQAAPLLPETWQTHADLAGLYRAAKRPGEAIREYEKVLQLRPGDAVFMNHLAWVLATAVDAKSRDPSRARKLAVDACEITKHRVPGPLDTLAAAQAASGDFEAAITSVTKAIELLSASGGSTAKMRARLGLYQAGKAYVEK